MDTAQGRVRCTAIFHGHVQGVGFRLTTTTVAMRYPIIGYVRNESDGTVLLVVEGERETVLHMIRSVEEAMPGHVDRTDLDWGPATGEFDGFGIQR